MSLSLLVDVWQQGQLVFYNFSLFTFHLFSECKYTKCVSGLSSFCAYIFVKNSKTCFWEHSESTLRYLAERKLSTIPQKIKLQAPKHRDTKSSPPQISDKTLRLCIHKNIVKSAGKKLYDFVLASPELLKFVTEK